MNPGNERVTEQIVRERLGLPDRQGIGLRHWEQTPDNERVRHCLRHASKRGGANPGAGHPEFVVTFDEHQDFLIVVECKADIARHATETRDRPADFAVDGALHYARHLSREFNTLAIGVSGIDADLLRVDHLWLFKGESVPYPAFGDKLLPATDYLEGYLSHSKVTHQDLDALLRFARELNLRLHGLKIRDAHRSLLVGAILMALRDAGFADGYRNRASPASLLADIRGTMLDQMERAGLPPETLKSVAASYAFLDSPGDLTRREALRDLVCDIERRAHIFRRTHQYHDMLGRFYVEFLSRSSGDKGLGVVLTPPHIAQLAVNLAAVGSDDILYDNCAGTGGFLVAGLKRMIESAAGDRAKENDIKRRGLLGVERQPDMAALLCANMFMHGDGRSGMFLGDCFSPEVRTLARERFRPSVGLLNPPFKRATRDREELEFVLNNLHALTPGGRCVALLPMQRALAVSGRRLELKKKLLERHTLEAVLSLPDGLFHDSRVAAVTCLLVIAAHRPHPSGTATWFAFCKDDGFVIKKPFGRCDPEGIWERIERRWLHSFRNRAETPGFSVLREVGAEDEWCAEAYIETDYAALIANDAFAKAVRERAAFVAARAIRRAKISFAADARPADARAAPLPEIGTWGEFTAAELFDIVGARSTPLEELEEAGPGPHPYVTTQSTDNGVRGYFDHFTEAGGIIVVESAVLGFASYQAAPFSASDHVEKLVPRFPANIHLGLFLTTILNANRFRHSYGRKASQERLRRLKLRLPAGADGAPDWELMTRHMRSLPFSEAASST